jgi:hypothetical protein
LNTYIVHIEDGGPPRKVALRIYFRSEAIIGASENHATIGKKNRPLREFGLQLQQQFLFLSRGEFRTARGRCPELA